MFMLGARCCHALREVLYLASDVEAWLFTEAGEQQPELPKSSCFYRTRSLRVYGLVYSPFDAELLNQS